MVRKMQVMKMRGQASIPGLHTFRITEDGLQIFPRLIVGPPETPLVTGGTGKAKCRPPRQSVGVPRLDEMLGGGIPSGYSVHGIAVGERVGDYQGLLTGGPHLVSPGSQRPSRRPPARRRRS
jgi:hypothetical protein